MYFMEDKTKDISEEQDQNDLVDQGNWEEQELSEEDIAELKKSKTKLSMRMIILCMILILLLCILIAMNKYFNG